MITVDKLDVVYGAKENRNHVVRGVSLTVNRGETLGIVGESGCGKSTLLRSLAGLEAGWTGSISFNGKPVGKTRSRDELKLAQMVFQDPYGSLHPRHRIGRALAEPIRAMGLGDGWSKVPAALQQVGLPAHFAERFPHELSGGQRQRVAIARALILEPPILLLDEPTSALDPELVNEVLDVIKELSRSGVTLIIVTHEIGFAREVSDRVVFMEQGRILETGTPEKLFNKPDHPRTAEFLAKVL